MRKQLFTTTALRLAPLRQWEIDNLGSGQVAFGPNVILRSVDGADDIYLDRQSPVDEETYQRLAR